MKNGDHEEESQNNGREIKPKRVIQEKFPGTNKQKMWLSTLEEPIEETDREQTI